ncbi:MAG: hypothetical protein CVV49_00985 [Spirochaetae bacterium HGW-Spirochaetae-5]|nr:MAG: hypothetical protein CVV49_00985 [Spirochaetae bacterium HGW-Spirochaetae-5]
MIKFGELGIELKSGMIFSALALVLSVIAGLAGGVPGGMVLFRSLILTPVFFVVGFGIILIIKKFVPEVYEIISNPATSEDPAEKVDITGDLSMDSSEDISEKSDTGFSEFTAKDYDRLQTVNDSGLDSALSHSNGKLGKHIIVENQFNSYEPKLMAMAIKTMMSKDKD